MCEPLARRVLELGAGLGLVGTSLARLGASSVTLTDMPQQLSLLRANVEANRGEAEAEAEAEVEVSSLVWGSPLQRCHAGHEVVVAADVVYDEVQTPPNRHFLVVARHLYPPGRLHAVDEAAGRHFSCNSPSPSLGRPAPPPRPPPFPPQPLVAPLAASVRELLLGEGAPRGACGLFALPDHAHFGEGKGGEEGGGEEAPPREGEGGRRSGGSRESATRVPVGAARLRVPPRAAGRGGAAGGAGGGGAGGEGGGVGGVAGCDRGGGARAQCAHPSRAGGGGSGGGGVKS